MTASRYTLSGAPGPFLAARRPFGPALGRLDAVGCGRVIPEHHSPSHRTLWPDSTDSLTHGGFGGSSVLGMHLNTLRVAPARGLRPVAFGELLPTCCPPTHSTWRRADVDRRFRRFPQRGAATTVVIIEGFKVSISAVGFPARADINAATLHHHMRHHVSWRVLQLFEYLTKGSTPLDRGRRVAAPLFWRGD